MLLILLCSISRVVFSFGEQDALGLNADDHKLINVHANSTLKSSLITPHNNHSYIDKAENMLVLPMLNKFYDEQKSKKKIFKKSPKRTIQKIIKKNRVRMKTLHGASSKSTSLPNIAFDNIHSKGTQKKDESPTTQPNLKKKMKRWSTKVARYPMPFQKLQSRKDFGWRRKRSDDIDNTVILKDFDNIENVSKDKADDVNNAHVDFMFR